VAVKNPGEPFTRITSHEAKIMMDVESAVAVIDVRALDERTSGYVSGSIHIPVDDIITRIDQLPKDKKLLFICAAGQRSGLACEMAAAMGLEEERLYNIEDGTPTWIGLDYPTSYGD